MLGETIQSTGPYGFDNNARNDSSGVEAVDAPLMHVDEAVRMALTPDPVSKSSDDRVPVVAGRQDLAISIRHGQSGEGFASVVNAPPGLSHPTDAATFIALQEWEGHVLEINGDEFVAALVDLTAGSSHEEEEAIIPLSEIADEDATALRVGAIFRWVIGYERSRSGTKKRVSQIVFRDLPRVTERDLQQGREWARETRRAFNL